MKEYPYTGVAVIDRYLPEMRRLGVSKVARGPGGFIQAYRRYGARDLPLSWKRKRNAFIARHLAQYRKNPTERRRLALIAWAYMP